MIEVSLATGERVPRYALWLKLHERGSNPEELTRNAAMAFCDGPLQTFLADRGLRPPPRAACDAR